MFSHAVDHDEAVRHAQNHGSGDHSMYSSALSHAQQNKVRRTGTSRNAHCSLRRSLRHRTSILSTRTLPKTRIAGSMRRVPVAIYLRRPWAALRPSRYALLKLAKPLFEPQSCTGTQKVHVWWWRRWRRFADTVDQHGYGRGIQALRSAWRFQQWREARRSQRRGYDCHQTSCPEQVQ
jgi:hypothetical protein